MRALRVIRAGPAMTIQDLGRPGFLARGLSRGGAMDRLALREGAALLGQPPGLAALEMAGSGGELEATEELRIALTGAPMTATIDGTRVAWNASHTLQRGARLAVGGAIEGVYGYLSVGGGFDTPLRLGSRSAHLAAGLGALVGDGETLPVAKDTGGRVGLGIRGAARFSGGLLRVVPGPQTRLFSQADLERFTSESFRRDTRGNRMGVRLQPQGQGYVTGSGLSILSEIVVPGDIQMTGDGSPFVLMVECQTTGGYPRIGTVIAADLPRMAQAAPGTRLRFAMLSTEAGFEADAAERRRTANLARDLFPLVRDPATIDNLLSYQLISGVTAGDDLERENP